MKTSIGITITVKQGDQPAETFSHITEAECDDMKGVWSPTVAGLEQVMSQIHRRIFPTEEEAMQDAQQPSK